MNYVRINRQVSKQFKTSKGFADVKRKLGELAHNLSVSCGKSLSGLDQRRGDVKRETKGTSVRSAKRHAESNCSI